MTDRRKILYAEDNERVKGTFLSVLKKFFPEYPTEAFADGGSLEKRLAGNLDCVALVLTDNEMPGKTGLDIIKDYSRRNGFRQTPFILFYSGHEAIGQTAVENGAFAYIIKGSSIDEMKGIINKALTYSEPTASSQ